MTAKETAHCHIIVLRHMLQQVEQIKAQLQERRPEHMSLQGYAKVMSDVEAQRAALDWAIEFTIYHYGNPPRIIEGAVRGGVPTNAPETPHDLEG